MDLSNHAVAAAAGGEAAARNEPLALLRELTALRANVLAAEPRLVAAGPAPPPPGARNLAHYLALRRHDLRPLQERLAALGLSSLGRAEPQVLRSLDQVLAVLRQLAGRPAAPPPAAERAPGRSLLARQVELLFGPPPARRGTRIMVTLPSEAAADPGLAQGLVAAGMDVARINCAHDGADAWAAMAGHVREAARRAGREVRILMDLGGPKIRTGPIEPGPAVLKLRPQRDALGRVTAPARLWLHPPGGPAPAEPPAPSVEVAADWLARLRAGDEIGLVDARGRKRRLTVRALQAGSACVECERTLYLVPETVLAVHAGKHATGIGGVPAAPGRLRLRRGQRLRLTADGLGHAAEAADRSDEHGRAGPARVACTLPEVFAQLRAGEPVWFDDGRIGGVIRRASDIVGLSFAQSAADVDALRGYLAALAARPLGVVLKIETRRGFERLPEMLFAAMAFPAAGVMIGDLAVECGFERLAEVQEEILWACEAAHLPVVWATQVLESQAKTGRPSRAEVTDAAMSGRADCVMLNKGPHVPAAMRTLDDILRRMQQHQAKKRSLLRALKAWTPRVVAGGG